MLKKLLAKLPKRKPSERHRLRAGQVVTLRRPGGAGNVVLARDEESFSALLAARRLAEFTELREAGKLFIADNGTPARVLEARPDRVLVFLHADDSPAEHRAGWAEARHVITKG